MFRRACCPRSLLNGGWQWGERVAVDELYRHAAGAFLATIIFSQIGNVLACRTARLSAVPELFNLNAWMGAGLIVELVFILSIVYVPVFHGIFTTAPIDLATWGLILLAPPVIFLLEELRKLAVRRGAHMLAA